eukprot:CAMPEP_0118634254 /NCGR_PEP_ID=MMETSP0785-20121206/1441_1 /TAXON_ID=91992 /ORGANISM="Bolidomonas pacifica, Strain CCMP 1866" /LENGTH=630 /DNA_ID=CAMNT_0006525201 /DNA_START=23 /DNA_END=1911 /DNA_ORIENTATION=+
MGAAASLGGAAASTSSPPKSSPMTLCASALGNGGAGAQASKLPDTNTVVVLGGGASCSISYAGSSLINDLNYFSMKLSMSGGGPMPTIEGHSLTGLSGRKAVVLGGLMAGRRSSGFAGGFSNTQPELITAPSQQPVKNSMSALWVLNIGTRRASGTSIAGLGVRRNSKTDSTGTSTWHRQQLLGQPPTRRAYHSAHRVLVGGNERIVIYGGEIGNTLSRPSSRGSNKSDDASRNRDHIERINEKLAALAMKSPNNAGKQGGNFSPATNESPNGDKASGRRGSKGSIAMTPTQDNPANVPTNSRRNSLTSLGSVGSTGTESHFSFSEDDINESKSPSLSPMKDARFGQLSPMSLSLGTPMSGKKNDFNEQDDDDGFIYVLDCASWIWKAGTCATETIHHYDKRIHQEDDEDPEVFASTRSFYPPARARHTATPVTEDGEYAIFFGGYKTKTTYFHNEVYGDNTYTSSIGQPLNDAWTLQTIENKSRDSVRFLWKRLKNLGAPPSARWGHLAVSIGSGAMVVFGGCGEAVDLDRPRNPVNEIKSAMEDCFVFHLGGIVTDNATPLSKSVEIGDGLWIRVPGNCGLGKRVCPAATVTGGAIIVFGGCKGKNDDDGKVKMKGHVGKQLKDARFV